MDIKITDKALRYFLDTPLTPEKLAHDISLCGPTFDRVSKVNGDYLYEIEVITNRIDTASAQGIARDSAAILNQMGIKSRLLHDPYLEKINLYPNLPKTFRFEILDNSLVPRFTAVSLENVSIQDSPKDTQSLLSLSGERPINNAVDITNELTLLYGLPGHIFDLDKLAAQKLTIRESKSGEEVATLDGQNNKLKGGDLVIEDGAGRLVDLCGVMGGSVAEVDQHTKNILLIFPVYQPSKVRRTSLYLQKRTLASQIYEKQPDTELCLPVLMNAIKLFGERTGSRVSSAVYDSNPLPPKAKDILLDINWANNLIGIQISPKTVVSILESLGFSIKNNGQNQIICTVPSWRRYDINIKEDLVEEIARVYGYSKLPPTLPCVNLPPETKNKLLDTESKIKTLLSAQGFNEVYNNSLISLDLIEKTMLKETSHLKLNNALSKDYEYLRTTLVPSILQNIKNNQGKTEEPFYFYEISNVYLSTGEKLPQENSMLVIGTTTSFQDAKGHLALLLEHLNVRKYNFKSSASCPIYFVAENTAVINSNDSAIGFIGSIKPAILHKLGITSNPIVVELDAQKLANSISENYIYKPISDFPDVVEQITISSNERVGDIIEKICSADKLIKDISYLDSFEKNHSFKITFSSPDKNLTQSEVNDVKKIIKALFN